MTTPFPLLRQLVRFNIRHLGAMAVAFGAAFVLLPRPSAFVLLGRGYGDERHLSDRVSTAFVDYWQAGQRALTPELAHLVVYWRWFHVVKVATATGLLIVLLALAVRLWTAYAGARTPARAWSSGIGGVVVTMLSVFAFMMVLANVQSTLVPFASLMSMLPVSSAHGALEIMVGQVRDELAHYPVGSSGALGMMVDDLARYHVVVAVISWSVAVVLLVLTVASWRRYSRTARTDRRARRLFLALGMEALLVSALVAVLAIANTSAAVDSPMAVLNFYRGTF